MILGIIIGIAICAIPYLIYLFATKQTGDLLKIFDTQRKIAAQGLVEKKNTQLKEINDEIQKAQEAAEKKKEAIQNSYQEFEKDLLNKQKEKIEQMNELDKQNYQELQIRMQNNLEEEQKKYSAQLSSLKEQNQLEMNKLKTENEEQKEKIHMDFFAFSEQINLKKENLKNELEEYKKKQNQIIARFQEDEKIRLKRDFHKITIDINSQNDIQKLKDLAKSFNRADAIYKLIWEVYYKTPMEALFKKILGDNANNGGIYKITNINNEKVYIGRSVKLLDRWRTHCKRGCGIEKVNGLLYDAMMEEGLQNFTFEIIEISDKESLSEKEKYWINFYKSNEWGYNQNKGG